MRGRTFVCSRRKVERAGLDDERLAAAGRGCGSDDLSVDDFVTVAALRTFLVAADPFGSAQREMMPTGPALPHIVINALDPLFCLLPLLEQRIVVRLAEAGHQRLTRRAASASPAPLAEADDRAHAEWNGSQHADHDRNDAGRTALVDSLREDESSSGSSRAALRSASTPASRPSSNSPDLNLGIM